VDTTTTTIKTLNEEYTTDDEAIQEDTGEDRIAIEDINIMTEMNTSQMAIEQEEGVNIEETPTHGYNLRRQPTRNANRVSMTQAGHMKEWRISRLQEWKTTL